MTIANSWAYTETSFNHVKFSDYTKNQYRLVSQRPYVSKKDENEKGITCTLQITKDEFDYGVDKKTGIKRDDNRLNTFDVTILNGKQRLDMSKGDYVSLNGFIKEKSFIIGFDLILRYKNLEKINVQTK